VRAGLAHLPLALLVAPMGLGGAGLAWRQAATTLGAPGVIGEALLVLTALVWLAVVAGQAARGVLHPAALAEDLAHPVRSSFLAAPTIGLMILSGAAWRHAPGLGAALWCVAVPLHLLVAMWLLRRIFGGAAVPAMLAPPLLVPLVGNIVAPVFGVQMGFGDASWMMFGVGFVLWMVVLPLLLGRLFHGPALPPPLQPSLGIMLAPPAVAALAIGELAGSTGGAALGLTGVAVLFAAVLVSMAGDFARLPFSLTWWSFTFPSAAFAVLTMAEGFHPLFCWAALLACTAITCWVAWRTARLALAGAFLRPEA